MPHLSMRRLRDMFHGPDVVLHKYKPLANPEAEIRLAVLQPGSGKEKLLIKFISRQLNDIEPEYEALSYAWGSQDDPSYVYVSSGKHNAIRITRNLRDALRQLRFRDKPRALWIDALCIDQNTRDEKNRQVAAMGKVFASANKVIVWLGLEQDDSDKALDTLQWLSERVKHDTLNFKLIPTERCTEEERNLADEHVSLPYYDGELTPVLALFQRPYFKRTWIRQEISLAMRSVLYCGARTMPLQHFFDGVVCVCRSQCERLCVPKGQWENFRIARRFPFALYRMAIYPVSFTSLRRDLDGSECQDPRDKIYSTLGMLTSVDRSLGVEPNYSLTVEEVYTDVARRVTTQLRNLNLFASCSISTRALDVPSWVPDWSTPIPRSSQIDTLWSSCGWLSLSMSASCEKSLTVAGVEVAQVEEIINLDIYDPDGSRDYSSLIHMLQSFSPIQDPSNSHGLAVRPWAVDVCLTLHSGEISQNYYPGRTDLIDLDYSVDVLQKIWSSNLQWNDYEEGVQSWMAMFMDELAKSYRDLRTFKTSNNYTGICLPGVQEEDKLCVLLGSRYPVLLRPKLSSDNDSVYEVVGVSCVPGMMKGEIIYGSEYASRYRPLINQDASEEHQWIDSYQYAFCDPEKNILLEDPAEILEDVGIKVENYQRSPHILDVLPETLETAGIALKYFKLV